MTPNLYVALIHYPVVNRAGDVVASAVTNLDLHDISRAAKTYGVRQYYVVTPLKDQQELIRRIISHWVEGAGARYNPKRREAMALISLVDSFEEACRQIQSHGHGNPVSVVTSAKRGIRSIDFDHLRRRLQNGTPHVLVFGTAWGLSESFISEADFILQPVEGTTDYNHLSVRSAAAIVLDRLMGKGR